MRVIFLTLRLDNLPETGKRQYENKQDANPPRRHGVDCTTIRHEKICAVIFPPNETRHAFRCGATSEELIELSEVAGSERIAGSSYRAVASLQRAGPAQPRPRSVRARVYGGASCRCRFSERRTSFQSVVSAPPKNYLCFPATVLLSRIAGPSTARCSLMRSDYRPQTGTERSFQPRPSPAPPAPILRCRSAGTDRLHVSIPAAVLVARQSKFGSLKMAILSSVSFNRHALMALTSWLDMFCAGKIPQLELRSAIHSAFSSIARLRLGSRSSLSWIALFSLAAASLSSGSPQNNCSAGWANAAQ
jgi:hypothetical protein